MEQRMTQTKSILEHMKSRPISPREALRLYGCMRLSARIHDLRSEGNHISMEYKTGKNQFGQNVTFSEYSLESVEVQA